MAKNGNTFFVQLSREIYMQYRDMPTSTLKLYIWLVELEHRYTGKERDFFFRTNEQLTYDVNLSLPVIKKCKKDLINRGLVECWQSHFIMPDGKRSEKKVTCYRILRNGRVPEVEPQREVEDGYTLLDKE